MNRRGLVLGTAVFAVTGIAYAVIPHRGVIENATQSTLWVVETDQGYAVAHLLGPGRRSPPNVDADGVRAEGESRASLPGATTIAGHRSWWKVSDVSRATVRGVGEALQISCVVCRTVEDREFGPVRYDGADGWGEPTD